MVMSLGIPISKVNTYCDRILKNFPSPAGMGKPIWTCDVVYIYIYIYIYAPNKDSNQPD